MKPQDEFWWAYVDSEMTPAEAAQFDRTLSSADHERMTAEMDLERRLSEKLSAPLPEEADQAWKKALAQVKAKKRKKIFPFHARPLIPWLSIPIAALAIFTICFYYGYGAAREPWFLSMNPHDAQKVTADATPDTALSVRNLLRDHDMNIAFDPADSLAAEGAPYRLLSAHGAEYVGEEVVELLFYCGDQPAKMIIVNAGGNAAREIDRAVAKGRIRAARPVGDWMIALVGSQAPDDLLSLIREPEPPQPTPEVSAPPAAPPAVSETPAPASPAAPEKNEGPAPSYGYPRPIKVAA